MADLEIATDFSGRPVRRSFTDEEIAAATADDDWDEEVDEVLTLPDGRDVVDLGPPDPVRDPFGETWYEYDSSTGRPDLDKPVDQATIDAAFEHRAG